MGVGTKILDPTRRRGVKASDLTEKQYEFCELYLANGMNGTQAAKEVGYSRPTSQAGRLLSKPTIKAYLSKRRSEIIDQIEITREELLSKIKRTLDFNLMKYARSGNGKSICVDEEHYDEVAEMIGDCVTKIKVKEIEDNVGNVTRQIEIDLISKERVLELAMKYKGMLTDKVEAKINNEGFSWDELLEEVGEDGEQLELPYTIKEQ